MNFSDSASAWAKLRLLEAPVLSKRYLQDVDRGHETMSSFLLSAHVTQARHFFRNAADSSVHTRPLLLYYGVLQLAKALIITKLPERASMVETQKHGLAVPRKRHPLPYWKQTIWIQPSGVFLEWLRASDALQSEEAVNHFTGKLPMPVNGLWGCLPETIPILDALDIPVRCAPLHVQVHPEEPKRLVITLSRTWPSACMLTMEECEQMIASALPNGVTASFDWTAGSQDMSRRVQSTAEPARGQRSIQLISELPMACLPRPTGNWLALSPLPQPVLRHAHIPEPLIYFTLLFHLSMILRYDAEAWSELLGDGSTLESLLIERLCDLVTSHIPQYFVRALGI